MKKLFTLCLSLALAVSLTACGEASPSGSSADSQSQPSFESDSSSATVSSEPLSEREVRQMYSDPGSYIGSTVELTGQVFAGVEYDSDGVYFQMWADPENIDLNTVISFPDPEFELEDGDYVKLTGEVWDVFEGQNMMGGTIIAPAILANKLEILSYKDAIMPTIASAVATTPTIDQFGYSVTVQNVELAEKETRIYVSIENNGANEFTLYDFNAVLIQDSTQYESQRNYNADYPEFQNDIRPGIKTEGVMVFPAINQGPFQIIMEASSSDWHEDIPDYVFDCTISDVVED